ncbi:MAG: glycosyltransferase family 4 protein [Acidobacteria bacterium]|nr:glycosyltransferase family 4 protein [Acidobacteriota bacterium]
MRRFSVRRERTVAEFGQASERVFNHRHSFADELSWLDSEGPTSPELVRHLGKAESLFDFFIFFSYRYYHAYHGVRAVPRRAILVPTAERDPAIGVGLFHPIFRSVRAIMYNSPEERALIQRVSQNEDTPGVVVGIGSDIPAAVSPNRFRQKYNVRDPFAIYVGRIDENKGCKELFGFFERYIEWAPTTLSLVLLGEALLPIPAHPRIRHLGYLSDADKFDAIAASDLLIMPSYFESLSMVALEAWALGKPVLVNGKCDVLRGQCVRSNAGLYYETFAEFGETLYALESNRPLRLALGQNGRDFYRANYGWPVIEGKYLDMVRQLQQEDRSGPGGGQPRRSVAAMPGWFRRRRHNLPPARDILARLPTGPVVDLRSAAAEWSSRSRQERPSTRLGAGRERS